MYCPNCGKKIHDNSILCDYCHSIVNDFRNLGIEPLDLGAPYKKAIADAETEAKKAKRTFLIAMVLLPFIAGILGAMVWPLAIVCLGIWAVLGFKLLSCNMRVDKANRAYVKYASDNAERWRKAEEEDANRNPQERHSLRNEAESDDSVCLP
ncbi:MAG: zinc-ribbon domain-containing protein [Bacteroidales bacterium]|nr:zinc-ribbon domain-containing protein [Bacteroidales bacterium]